MIPQMSETNERGPVRDELPALAWGNAVRVEHCLDVPQRREERPQVLHVADLGRVPVLRELVVHDTAVRDDVRAVLGERARDVLEQARPVPRVDANLDEEAL